MDIDGTIQAAAAALERATAELTDANATLDAAKVLADRIAGQLAVLGETRDAIIARRSAGDHREGDAGQLALIQADTEGLQPMAAEANAALAVARKAITDRTGSRQHALTELSTAEDRVLLAALVERAKAMDVSMLDLVTRIGNVAKRLRCEPWVASHELRTKLYMDAVQNPRLAEAGRPGSKWPALRTA
jgi:chromosome segregation ATPase